MISFDSVSTSPTVAERFVAVRQQIEKACLEAGRKPSDVVLTAVSKTQPAEALSEALATGQMVFGENRVQEAQSHWSHQREGLELRLIGPLQTNKALDAVRLFDVIETLDREKLAGALADAQEKAGKRVRILVQVNTGAEPQKAGVLIEDAPALIRSARETYGLTVEGLMCIPPVDADPSAHFNKLKKLADDQGLAVLSMGMSSDFEQAIACGATHVRIGSSLFGERK